MLAVQCWEIVGFIKHQIIGYIVSHFVFFILRRGMARAGLVPELEAGLSRCLWARSRYRSHYQAPMLHAKSYSDMFNGSSIEDCLCYCDLS